MQAKPSPSQGRPKPSLSLAYASLSPASLIPARAQGTGREPGISHGSPREPSLGSLEASGALLQVAPSATPWNYQEIHRITMNYQALLICYDDFARITMV